MMRIMKRLSVLPLAVLLAVGACSKSPVPGEESGLHGGSIDNLSHGLIELGEKLEDPYTVENMEKALRSLYPTKADRVDIHPTDLYVRFLPKDDAQLATLRSLGLYLVDHPLDYRIAREGDYYQDPDVGEGNITWQYSVVPHDFTFPSGISYQVLDRCYISEHSAETRSDIDWAAVEQESFRLTGNASMLPSTKADAAVCPRGRITVMDPKFAGGKPVGLAGVKVAANIFVKIATCHTDRDGYYNMDTSFKGEPRYRLVFQNSAGFSIGLNLIIIPASVSTLGKGSPQGVDYTVTEQSDPALFRRCAVNNAAYDYYSRCNSGDLDIAPPPSDLRIWIFPMLKSSSTVMLHHGAILDHGLIQKYVGQYIGIIRIFLPDITIGTSGNDSFSAIYYATVHELSHASHYSSVGNGFWSPYAGYILRSFILEGGTAYGYGSGENAGLCEVGEMWAYFMAASLYKDRYGGSMPDFPSSLWFRPQILGLMYERGMSRADIFRALTPEVTGRDDFKEELIRLYKDRESLINECFARYER